MENIGKILKEARESKDLTLDDISKETHIMTRYLSAIEEENYSIVPDRIYVIGIIRKYADYLGLDGGEMVKDFLSSVDTQPISTPTENEKKSRHSMNINTKPLITILTVCVLIGIFAIVMYMNPYRDVKQPAAPPSPGTQTSPVSKSPAVHKKNADKKKEQPVKQDELTMVIKFSGDCWIKAVDDEDNVLDEKKYSSGETTTLKAKEINLRLGYPRNAEIEINGKKIPPIGTDNPITKKFTLEDINSQS